MTLPWGNSFVGGSLLRCARPMAVCDVSVVCAWHASGQQAGSNRVEGRHRAHLSLRRTPSTSTVPHWRTTRRIIPILPVSGPLITATCAHEGNAVVVKHRSELPMARGACHGKGAQREVCFQTHAADQQHTHSSRAPPPHSISQSHLVTSHNPPCLRWLGRLDLRVDTANSNGNESS